MKKRYGIYTRELKLEIVKKAMNPKTNIKRLADEFGIPETTVHSWKKDYQRISDESYVKSPDELNPLETEIKRLKKALADKEETCEILKKAIAIFSEKQKK